MAHTEIVTTHRWEINGLTNPLRVPFVVSMHSNGYLECSCPRWQRQMNGHRRACPHIALVRLHLVDLVMARPTVAPLPALPTPPVGYTGRRIVDVQSDLVIAEREVVLADAGRRNHA